MSLINPTQLRIGSNGILNGASYRVVGRVVMSVFDGGICYYWSEFQLESQPGQHAILVYEETKRGGEWRFFTKFDPNEPMSIEDAEEKGLGDSLNLDGSEVRVTFVGKSRVSRIEGWAPEGEAVGKEEDYFNAEAGARMIVVSWIGRNIEFYHGETLSGGVVERAFGIPKPSPSLYALSTFQKDSERTPANIIATVIALSIPILLLGLFFCDVFASREPAMKVLPAKPGILNAGEVITLNGKSQRVIRDESAEISEVGLRFVRHEYTLVDDDGNQSLISGGPQPGENELWLLAEFHPANSLSPQQAGDVKAGQSVSLDDLNVTVHTLFLSKSRLMGGASMPGGGTQSDTFGFSGGSGSNVVMARWNQQAITFYRGTVLSHQAVKELTEQGLSK